ncbi:Uncharacterized conserved protein, DUF2164 family [Vibrio hangzhouensis]|uniref:Uncharacterized conserved protein, DUF2164 family n=2 Tax=Vibrio hangzhouensis TaxID=462991 RepID=A0A1H5WTV9_9VIBR|nr:Uncharacterized conserved protein, DUF2164 family [Vibrio hangzhouensis]
MVTAGKVNNMLDKNKREQLISELQKYFMDELDYELGQFDGEFLLDFLSKKLAPAYYNKGLEDAKAVLERRLTDITEELYEIEMPDE